MGLHVCGGRGFGIGETIGHSSISILISSLGFIHNRLYPMVYYHSSRSGECIRAFAFENRYDRSVTPKTPTVQIDK